MKNTLLESEWPGSRLCVCCRPRRERNAVLEARRIGIPIVGIVDTNCDPDEVDFVIPGNDDAIRAIRLFSSIIADAVMEGKQYATEGREEVTTEGEAVPETEVAVSMKYPPTMKKNFLFRF